jgi:dTDP-4-amino-4,6-dideoxygalactose transaminase
LKSSSDLKIPFNIPSINDEDVHDVVRALHSPNLSGDGEFTKLASKRLSSLLDGRRVLLTTSCTHALEMMGYLAGLGPGDEVIVPSFTFVSTANAFVARGAVPVFVDIDPLTLNIDPSLVAEAVTPRTRAVTVVHYGGVAADMDDLTRIAESSGLSIFEDNAHGLGATYHGRPLGTIGQLAAQSFHATKNIVMGEGGALVINDESLLRRAEILREKGTNRSQFLRGDVDKYTWVDAGSSYLPSDILAALLYAQLGRFDEIQTQRHQIWNAYFQSLTDWAVTNAVRLPHVPDYARHSAHLFYLLMPTFEDQVGLIEHLRESGIQATSHYRPLHDSIYGKKVGRTVGVCSVTTSVADSIVRLPLYPQLTATDVDRVISAVVQYVPGS